MGACCCIFADESPTTFDDRPSRPEPTGASPHAYNSTAGSSWQAFSRPRCCRYCGVVLDLSLLEGHEESCRVNHLKSKGEGVAPKLQPTSGEETDLDTVSEDELCVVCFQRRRCYVFLPCGHIACCGECTKRLEACPMCRAPRSGLCYVPSNVLSQYYCNSCGHFIAPTLFDGHRETCAVLLRQTEAQQQLKHDASDAEKSKGEESSESAAVERKEVLEQEALTNLELSSSNKRTANSALKVDEIELLPTTHHSKHVSPRCVECGKEDCKLVVCIPCGHRVLCSGCASSRSTCSVCLQEIKEILNSFD